MVKKIHLITFFAFFCFTASAQEMTLKQCIEIARDNNNAVKIAKQTLTTREQINEAAKQNYLPKVDLLAGYNHLSNPLKLNFEQPKESIITGIGNQATGSANDIYQQITGNTLPDNIRQIIYNTTTDIVRTVYPNFNPELSKQDYLLAGIALRQPIYFGGKLKASRTLASEQLQSGKINLETAQDLTIYNVAMQYIQIMYLNSMIEKQKQSLNSLNENVKYATSLLKAEIIPPYQKNWADIAKAQAETNLSQLYVEKQNALLTLEHLMGNASSNHINIDKKLKEDVPLPPVINDFDSLQNADLRLLNSKKNEAKTGLDIVNSMSKPNIFAIANVQFLRKDLPVITPPWLVGIEMQWTLFDSERKSKKLASESLVKETELLINEKKEAIDLSTRVTQNKLINFKNQSEVLNKARLQSYITTEMIKKRMENSLSSVKDVNDALNMQYESEKLYYTSVTAYQAALATYLYILGEPENIAAYLN